MAKSENPVVKFKNIDHDDYMVYDDMISNIKAIVIELADLRVKLDRLQARMTAHEHKD